METEVTLEDQLHLDLAEIDKMIDSIVERLQAMIQSIKECNQEVSNETKSIILIL